nr:hypothetical protein [uncultured Oscillibacter sp.]
MTYENFFARVKELAPNCRTEAISRWRDFAAESVDSMQCVRFNSPADKAAAVERWLDVLYSGLETVLKKCGPEIASFMVDLGLERCFLYSGEMTQGATGFEKNENGRQVLDKTESAETSCPAVSQSDAEGRRTVRERPKALKKRSGRGKGKER